MDNQELEIELDNDTLELEITDDDNLEIDLGNSDVIYSNDYNTLNNQPQINSITLINNKTLDELNIQEKGDYANSRITNGELEVLFIDW